MRSIYLRYLIFFPILIFLLACSKTKPEQDDANKTKATEQEFIRGVIKIDANHEYDSIRFCDNSQEYQIYLNDEVYEEAQSLSQLVRPFYAEVYGQFTTSSGSAIFNVTQINAMTTIDLCNSPIQQSRAFGEEPFWSMIIANKKLDYVELGEETRQYTLLSQEISSSKRHYQGNQVQLELVRELCHDTMSDSVYGWQAELTLDGKVRKGCAVISSSEMMTTQQK